MREFLDNFKNKKNLINLLILLILILAIPLGLQYRQQIIKSRAAADPIVFKGPNVEQREGKWVLLDPEEPIQLELTSPLGPPVQISETADPTNVASVCTEDGQATISWNQVEGATHYFLRFNKPPTNDWLGPGDLVLGIGAVNSYTTGETPQWAVYRDASNQDHCMGTGCSNPDSERTKTTIDPGIIYDATVQAHRVVDGQLVSSSSQVRVPNGVNCAPIVTSQSGGLLMSLLPQELVKTVYADSHKISSESDGPGGCCDDNNGCRRDNNSGGFREVCDISNGACASGKSCRSETGCALDTDCGPGNHCEGGQCKDGPPTGQCQSARSLQSRFQLTGSDGVSTDPWVKDKTTTTGTSVNAAIFRNGEAAFAGARVNEVPIQDIITASITGPAGFSPQTVDVSKSNSFTPTQPGTYTLSATCSNITSDTATLTVTGSAPPTAPLSATLTGPSSGVVNSPLTFNANFDIPQGRSLRKAEVLVTKEIGGAGQLISDCAPSNIVGSVYCKIGSTNADRQLSTNWTPSEIGTYVVIVSVEDSTYQNNPESNGLCSSNPYVSYPYRFGDNGKFIDCGGDSARVRVSVTESTAPPPPVTTISFRVAENPTALSSAQWQPYTAEPVTVDFEFTDKTPGNKFVWVEFKDSNNRTERRSAQIRLLGAAPTIASCSLSFEGNNTILNLKGQNFGSTKGVIKSNETSLQARQWKNDSIAAVWPNAPSGQVLPVTLTNSDGQEVEGSCGAISQLALGAKVFCRAPASHDTDNVDLVLAGTFEGGTKTRHKVKIDKDGVIQGLTQKLEDGKTYKVSVKAPRSVRKTVEFTAGGGVTNIPNFVLPVGDIFPSDGGDGTINSLDKSELNRQWIIAADATGRSADFNKDGRVNSIDWACMRYDFNRSNDAEPSVPTVTVAPSTGSTGVGSTAGQ